jgi:hypothetical protein
VSALYQHQFNPHYSLKRSKNNLPFTRYHPHAYAGFNRRDQAAIKRQSGTGISDWIE